MAACIPTGCSPRCRRSCRRTRSSSPMEATSSALSASAFLPALTSIRGRSAASASACRSGSRPASPFPGAWCWSRRETGRSDSTPSSSTRPCDTEPRRCSWSRTMAPGRSRSTTRRRPTAASPERSCSSQITRRWRAASACMPSASSRSTTCQARSIAPSPGALRCSTSSSRRRRSRPMRSPAAWVPDLQPLAAWDEAERAWRDQPSR